MLQIVWEEVGQLDSRTLQSFSLSQGHVGYQGHGNIGMLGNIHNNLKDLLFMNTVEYNLHCILKYW